MAYTSVVVANNQLLARWTIVRGTSGRLPTGFTLARLMNTWHFQRNTFWLCWRQLALGMQTARTNVSHLHSDNIRQNAVAIHVVMCWNPDLFSRQTPATSLDQVQGCELCWGVVAGDCWFVSEFWDGLSGRLKCSNPGHSRDLYSGIRRSLHPWVQKTSCFFRWDSVFACEGGDGTVVCSCCKLWAGGHASNWIRPWAWHYRRAYCGWVWRSLFCPTRFDTRTDKDSETSFCSISSVAWDSGKIHLQQIFHNQCREHFAWFLKGVDNIHTAHTKWRARLQMDTGCQLQQSKVQFGCTYCRPIRLISWCVDLHSTLHHGYAGRS